MPWFWSDQYDLTLQIAGLAEGAVTTVRRPVGEGFDGWFTAAGPEHIDLGPIKGNLGDQLYDIPADVDLATFRAVDLWCEQFAVSFGAAALA